MRDRVRNILRPPHDWEDALEPSPVFVRAVPVTKLRRVVCAMHESLSNLKEPLWLMIPIDEEVAKSLDSVTLVTEDEVYHIQVRGKI